MLMDETDRFLPLERRIPKRLTTRLRVIALERLIKKMQASGAEAACSYSLIICDGVAVERWCRMKTLNVGPSGVLQAVMASDFALPRFRYLQKLLLVHRAWCYSRLANMLLYFFYKNAVRRSHLWIFFCSDVFSSFCPAFSCELVLLISLSHRCLWRSSSGISSTVDSQVRPWLTSGILSSSTWCSPPSHNSSLARWTRTCQQRLSSNYLSSMWTARTPRSGLRVYLSLWSIFKKRDLLGFPSELSAKSSRPHPFHGFCSIEDWGIVELLLQHICVLMRPWDVPESSRGNLVCEI